MRLSYVKEDEKEYIELSDKGVTVSINGDRDQLYNLWNSVKDTDIHVAIDVGSIPKIATADEEQKSITDESKKSRREEEKQEEQIGDSYNKIWKIRKDRLENAKTMLNSLLEGKKSVKQLSNVIRTTQDTANNTINQCILKFEPKAIDRRKEGKGVYRHYVYYIKSKDKAKNLLNEFSRVLSASKKEEKKGQKEDPTIKKPKHELDEFYNWLLENGKSTNTARDYTACIAGTAKNALCKYAQKKWRVFQEEKSKELSSDLNKYYSQERELRSDS